ncbi:wee1-like protein kinase [Asparagus officinalis]|uniref:wee1-like protein kinase n=1 Tax=Asparagus officinalis TaxID=4686 RepID=UPI00098E6146|nr:wee1-like protein kinase [Asparagus officinalis]
MKKSSKTPKSRTRGTTAKSSTSLATATAAMQSSPAGNLTLHFEHVSLLSSSVKDPASSRFQKLLEDPDAVPSNPAAEPEDLCILSQDFFCTPDYITPEMSNGFEFNKESSVCPKSPEKSVRNKRHRKEGSPCNPLLFGMILDPSVELCKPPGTGSQKKQNYVSQSAVALRCRVMPPPCIKNPYLNTESSVDMDIFGDRKSRSTGFCPAIGGDGLSRYRTDFHEIEQIGCGNFSHVFKVLKRIDGCMYAVKHTIRQLRHDNERRQALMEVQALAALGSHENVVGYYTSWFENEQLYIQMELCDQSLSTNKGHIPKGREVLEMLYQMAKALRFMHEKGIAHMDLKPENIYVKNGVYKIGDFGCATLTDRSLPIEEGDSRYMPQEILKDKYEHLDKVDIFSLGITTYELVKGSPLPDSGPQFSNLREGKIALLPVISMQFQSLIKAMMDPDPMRRPSAKEIMENPIFEKLHRASSSKFMH